MDNKTAKSSKLVNKAPPPPSEVVPHASVSALAAAAAAASASTEPPPAQVQDARFFINLVRDAKNLRQGITEESTTHQKVIDGLNAMHYELNKNIHNVDILLIEAKKQINLIKEECDAIVKAAPHYKFITNDDGAANHDYAEKFL